MQIISFFIFSFILQLKQSIISAKAIEHDTNPLQNIDNLNTFDGNVEEKHISKRQTEESVIKCNKSRESCLKNCENDTECTKKCFVCPTLIIGGGYDDDNTFDHTSIHFGRNATTIIKLTNLINNTNLIDVPTNVNTTNINHIHLYRNDSSTEGGRFGLGYNKEGSCCFVVEPRVCTPSSRGYRCHHKRHKTCGPQCTSRIIHAISKTKCNGHSKCHHGLGYVPQPTTPKCIHTPNWPYVSCGGNYKQFCGGCYDHYGHGAQAYYGFNGVPDHCLACYDEGFHLGPLYRRGPVFQPFYYHQPPCYLFGNCFMTPPCSMFGCFGHQFIDPVWGLANQGYMPYETADNEFAISNHVNDEESSEIPISDWGIELQKCQVVHPDGSKIFKNCTEFPINQNRYAGSPVFSDHSNFVATNDPHGIGYMPENEYANVYSNEYDHGRDNVMSSIHRKRHVKMNRRRQVIYDDE